VIGCILDQSTTPVTHLIQFCMCTLDTIPQNDVSARVLTPVSFTRILRPARWAKEVGTIEADNFALKGIASIAFEITIEKISRHEV